MRSFPMAESEDSFAPYSLSLSSQPQKMSWVSLKMIHWKWIKAKF